MNARTPEKTLADTIALLSNLELSEVASAASKMVQETSGSAFVAVAMWDSDLDRLQDRFISGSPFEGFEKFFSAFCDEFSLEESSSNGGPFSEIPAKSLKGQNSLNLPIYCWRLTEDKELCACFIFAAKEKKCLEELTELARVLPLSRALKRAWEFRELKAENTRLRSSYEELENKTLSLEDQTRKLIQDLTTRDIMRTRHMERANLVYSISNAVREFVDIQKVLETTVERIGTTFGISRCMLLRPANAGLSGPVTVYEYGDTSFPTRDLFASEEGQRFAEAAFKKTVSQYISEQEFDKQKDYEPSFLRTLGIKSGLLVPLVLREKVMGVLFLQDCEQPRVWSIDDISLIDSLADQVSVAIENAELHLEKERQAVTDGLTGIANRRGFNETYAREFERAARYQQPLSLILVDMDNLKLINDEFGHQVGDNAIKEIAALLKSSSRAVDLAARFGGDEFCLLLPNTGMEMAKQLAERIKVLLSNLNTGGPTKITASFGVASFPTHASDADTLFSKADAALYQSKQAGRDILTVASNEP